MDIRIPLTIISIIVLALAIHHPVEDGVKKVGEKLITAEQQAKAQREAEKCSRPATQRVQRSTAAQNASQQEAAAPASNRAAERQARKKVKKYQQAERRREKMPPLMSADGGRLCMQDKCRSYAYNGKMYCDAHASEEQAYTAYRLWAAQQEMQGWQEFAPPQPIADQPVAQQPEEEDPFAPWGWLPRVRVRSAPPAQSPNPWQHTPGWEEQNDIGATDYGSVEEIGGYYEN